MPCRRMSRGPGDIMCPAEGCHLDPATSTALTMGPSDVRKNFSAQELSVVTDQLIVIISRHCEYLNNYPWLRINLSYGQGGHE